MWHCSREIRKWYYCRIWWIAKDKKIVKDYDNKIIKIKQDKITFSEEESGRGEKTVFEFIGREK